MADHQRKTIALPDDVYDYLLDVCVRETPVQRRLREETALLEGAGMQTGPDQVALLQLLVRLIGARHCLEIGVFTGYSALGVALALPADGSILACDINETFALTAKRYWELAGVAEKIDLRLAPAVATLDSLLAEGRAESFDFAYIDADKSTYDAYYERALALLRCNGLMALDNMLWSGRVAIPSYVDEDTVALRRLNEKIAADERIDASTLSIGDGLTLVRKR